MLASLILFTFIVVALLYIRYRTGVVEFRSYLIVGMVVALCVMAALDALSLLHFPIVYPGY